MGRNYLVIDMGTGNSRVALVSSDGAILGISSFENRYYRDDLYEDASYFLPDEWEKKICEAIRELVDESEGIPISAITASGARQSVVLYDRTGKAYLGLPNIDNRGREWVPGLKDKHFIYEKTGRWAAEDFCAAKILGLKKKRPELYERIYKITSLSEWIGEVFTGEMTMEPSQACETQLFDIENLRWSDELCDIFGLKKDMLPDICLSGTSLGRIKPEAASDLHLSGDEIFIAGGADTQAALKAGDTKPGDIVIVSGTSSPIAASTNERYCDEEERCWTDCGLKGEGYLIETNPGMTGINYQRFKERFFPDVPYEELEEAMAARERFLCTASFTTLDFVNRQPLKNAGFIMRPPLDAEVSPIDLLWALVADIACSIYEQYKGLLKIIPFEKDYIRGCGGGLRSGMLCQMIADLTGKELVICEGFDQATVAGCARICNEYFKMMDSPDDKADHRYIPVENSLILDYYEPWRINRRNLNPPTRD